MLLLKLLLKFFVVVDVVVEVAVEVVVVVDVVVVGGWGLGVELQENTKCNHCRRRKVGLEFVVDFEEMNFDHCGSL